MKMQKMAGTKMVTDISPRDLIMRLDISFLQAPTHKLLSLDP
jgi:hypothetical protein